MPPTPPLSLSVLGTDAIQLPKGSTANRSGLTTSSYVGCIRYNTDTSSVEANIGETPVWKTIDTTSHYAYASYTNTSQSDNQLATTDVLFANTNPVLDNIVGTDTIRVVTYSSGVFTFNKDCVFTMSYAIEASSVQASLIVNTYAVITGTPAYAKAVGSGHNTDTASTTNLYFNGSYTFKQASGSTLKIQIQTVNGTASTNGLTLAAGSANISFLFHRITR
jgi:hypothetical protein